jgi:hypothetical protein
LAAGSDVWRNTHLTVLWNVRAPISFLNYRHEDKTMARKNTDGSPEVVTDRQARGGSRLTSRTLTVLISSLSLAVIAGAILFWYYL